MWRTKLGGKRARERLREEVQGVHCVFSKILKYSRLWPFSVFPRCQCVYTHQAGRKPALQQNWQSSEKTQNFKEKTQYFMNTLYVNCTKFYQKLLKDHGPWIWSFSLTVNEVRNIEVRGKGAPKWSKPVDAWYVVDHESAPNFWIFWLYLHYDTNQLIM